MSTTCKKTYYKERKSVSHSELVKIRDQVKNGEITRQVGMASLITLTGGLFESAIIAAIGVTSGYWQSIYYNYMSNSNEIQAMLDSNKSSYDVEVTVKCRNKGLNGCFCEVSDAKFI
ncbi:hypothetical protein [Clostridium faecium]|uniref:Uncharacterized protein n=1 Tax=Clostridium faecium TaxID=2762223 RepID=A0ABR8YNQ0_9CLOT|nr:hypothetical protein [Clostridium faecium]MBD8045816.1 hypothetical protein [Clostridium faecium]MDU1351043.1 hypothetical protein [Clostridium argentinense]